MVAEAPSKRIVQVMLPSVQEKIADGKIGKKLWLLCIEVKNRVYFVSFPFPFPLPFRLPSSSWRTPPLRSCLNRDCSPHPMPVDESRIYIHVVGFALHGSVMKPELKSLLLYA